MDEYFDNEDFNDDLVEIDKEEIRRLSQLKSAMYHVKMIDFLGFKQWVELVEAREKDPILIIDNMIKSFEDIEDYETCQKLLDYKKKI